MREEVSVRESVRRGIGGEFDLSPALLKSPGICNRIPVRDGRLVWLNSGRAALQWAWEALRQRHPDRSTCLLPGYLCPSVVQPFKEAGARIAFYRLDHRLQIDLDDLSSRLGPDVLAVVIIHYFGFPQPGPVLDLMESTDPPVYVIEDATHAWLSRAGDGKPPGQRGAITIYSPRKFFPIPDGGMAVVGDRDLRLNQVAPTDWHFALRRTTGLFLRWLFARTGIEAVNRVALALLHRAEQELDTSISRSQASWLSRRILLNLDIQGAAECRRRNYRILNEEMRSRQLPVWPLYEELPLGVTPLGLPVTCERRDDLRQFLIQRRVYPPVHWFLPPEQGLAGFPHLVELSHRILTLPIDQRYNSTDMTYILDCLNAWAS